MTDRASLSDRAGRVSQALSAWPRQRVPLDDLWQLLDDADPTSRVSTSRRRLLADTLTELVAAQIIGLPGPRSYDLSEQPALPRFITVINDVPERSQRRAIVWHPALAWAANARLTTAHQEVLERINGWLFTHTDQLIMPLRERSVEILDDEKAFDRLLTTNLFAPGRLTLELLRARRVAPPMHIREVGAGSVLLVIENSDTFDSVVHALAASSGKVGMVGWGAGSAFEASVLSIAQLARPVTHIAYFGDLDAKGLAIPVNAGRVATSIGLPGIQPADGLYAALQQAGRPRPGTALVTDDAAASLVSWLAEPQRQWAIGVLTSAARVAQESVNLSYLLREPGWRDGLAY
ncbi:Wadjet anti-phage system protein JetD domain-containing protein [Catellatospora sichuanensis]|uniref:Wadjet anti-phage system protein JetD domain-containing protein n=1 Tax=Catellatospora sichuanensis TaxID=1969805 RepID=UPI001183143E|nr:Wadjet anti-phage system protein JetD domain-containing protein [Catellatospora sichuanensis]